MTPAQPRHPLALLAERVNSEHTRTLAEVARFAHGLEPDQHTELIRIVQTGIQRRDESAKALRAQAEAETTWKARMNHACVRLDLRSKELTQRSKKAVGADKARDYWMGFGYASAAEVVSQEYRAALAQAGGESL